MIYTTYTYDTYGNQTQTTDANNHTTSTAYDTSTHTYPISTTNAKNQTTTMNYDLGTGNLLSSTDANSNTTTYTYDVFGRITKEIKPYDSSTNPTTNYQYLFDGTAPESTLVSKREATSSGTLDVYTYIDGIGRTIQTRAEAEDATKQIVVDTYQNALDLVAKQTVPHVDTLSTSYVAPVTAGNTQTSYDPVGRPLVITNPDATTKTMSYDHWTQTNTDENGHQIKQYFTAYGKISKVDELDSGLAFTTVYSYDATDNLTGILDAISHMSTYQYDTLGRKTKMIDPDMGTWNYEYDGVGNLTKQTDNKGVITLKTYDALNRATKVDYPTDTDTTFAYDLGKIGTLSIATDSAGTVSYSYDNRLRKIQESRTINGTTKTTAFDYDSADHTTKQTYPDSEQVNYAFNTQGEINSVTGSSAILSNIDYNALGKITKKDFANGLTTNYTYNATDFRLNQITTGTVQNMSYTYDNVGNVATIANNLTSKTQTFGYDAFDRLTTAQETGGYNYTYGYNVIGNLMSFNDGTNTTNYNYGENSAGIHALTSAFSSSSGSLASTPSLVQKNFHTQNTNSNATSFTSNVTSGNTIIVAITQWGATVSSVTDNHSNTYTAVTSAQHANSSSDYVQLYYAKNVTGGATTVTVAFSGTTDTNVGIYEYSGLDTSAPLDKVASNTGNGTTPNGGAMTTTIDNELYFVAEVDDNGDNASPTAGSGYTLEHHQDDSSSIERFASEDRVSAQGTYQSNLTLAAGSNWAVIGASFKPGSGGGTPTPTPTATPTPTPGVPALVQKSLHTQNTSSNATSFTSNVTTGNTIVVGITQWGATVSSVTDNHSNTYTAVTSAQHANSSSDYVQLYYAKNVTGGSTTVTVGFSGTTDTNVGVYEYSGLSTTAPLDQTTSATGGGTTPNGGNLVTTLDNEVYFAVGVDDNGNNSAPTAGSGYTLEHHQDDSSSIERFYSEDRVSNHGTYATNFSIATGSNWAVICASFKPATGATPTPTSGSTPTPTPASGGTTYTYDANGNQLSNGTNCYEYNEANQLSKVKKCSNSQTIAEYVYDYRGNRMVKKNYVNGTLDNTVTSWSDAYETKVIVGGATENTSYYFANNELIAKKDKDGNKTYFHNDHLGSTNVITNQSGALVEATSYDPWGEIKTGGTKSKFLYTGQERDSETNLHYYGARYYDPHIRRFTQPDTVIQNVYDPQALNRYSYVRNNPLRYTDPTGHISILDYNNALTQYSKSPSAITYNNVLKTVSAFQNQPTKSSSGSNNANNNSGSSGGGGYQPQKDSGGARDVLKPAYNYLIGNDIKTFQNPNSSLIQKGWAGIGILGAVEFPEIKGLNFASKAKLMEHFTKHAKGVGVSSIDEYLEGANKLFEGGEGVDAAIRSNGDALFYRQATNEFGIVKPDNIIRTYYSPSGGVQYFLREITK